MVLRTGRKCSWGEIEVGEVFAWEGCWMIFYKTDSNFAISLSDDWADMFSDNFTNSGNFGNWFNTWFRKDTYKLPKAIQSLWKEV